MNNEVPSINVVLDERAVRALSAAVNFTLDKWAGQEDLDQEELFGLKYFLQGAVLEFDFQRSPTEDHD